MILRGGAGAIAMWAMLFGLAAPIMAESPPYDCARIVTLAPSVTETAFALGLGDQVVGVSKYSEYPAEAKRRPLIGALLDLNFEAIITLKPTLVVVLSEFTDKIAQLQQLGVRTLVLEHRSTKGILESIRVLGEACGREERAVALRQSIDERLAAVQSRVRGRTLVRTMVVVGESAGDGSLRSLYLSGSDGFYNDVLEMAGGANVVQQMTLGISGVSAEGVIALNPDTIIEITMMRGEPSRDIEMVKKSWQAVPGVPAVQNGRIFVVSNDYVSVPGPRFPQIVEDFARLLHPEAF